MFEKHDLFVLVPVVLLVVVGLMIFLGDAWYRSEWSEAYTVCRNEVGERMTYEHTDFSPINYYPFSIDFDSQTAGVSCHVRRNGTKWETILSWVSHVPN